MFWRKQKRKECTRTVLLHESMLHSHSVLYCVLIISSKATYRKKRTNKTNSEQFWHQIDQTGEQTVSIKGSLLKSHSSKFHSLMYISMYMYIYISMCIYTHTYIYIHTHIYSDIHGSTQGSYHFVLSRQEWLLTLRNASSY